MPHHPILAAPATAGRRAGVALELRRSALQDALLHRGAQARAEHGQGTVEYVALILLVGAILSAVVASGAGKHFNIADTIGTKLSGVIKGVGEGKK
jgi:hypothetical protein